MIFIKNPVEGKVKTRLAASVGSTNALQVYKKLLRHTQDVAIQVDCDRQVWYSSMIDRRDSWNTDLFDKKLQQGDDLGERMSVAFRKGFETGYKNVVIIGSDCPDLTPQHIDKAFEELESNDAVIGPSKDGGYYLLGLTGVRPELFNDIAWSTPEVYEKTTELFGRLEMSFSTLEILNDIDTLEDLKKSGLTLP
ncbi:TIGR04282 family arsenosugar biosynthesis glycosyltransferase [Rhodohalobacter sp. 8-1]|uniref:TIGR04282 family arsenosugar biosynthesis glycosyltransferase n=1 Tax=Rhodohalobacter sp. 8-1 TaxID=3131972 RepID=UPI0030EEE26A